MTSFKEVRIAALAALQKSAWDADGYPIYCVMQDRHEDVHVGVYCNALSHIEVLSEHLDNATWCDGIKMHNARGESEDAERLFRYYTTVFLIMEECRQDLMDIGKTVSLRRQDALDGIATFTNKMLNHRPSQRAAF